MKNNKQIKNDKNDFLIITVSIIFSVFFIVSFVLWTFLPYKQMLAWKKGVNTFVAGDDSAFPQDPFIYKKYNPSTQQNIRFGAFSNLFNQYVNGKRTGYTPLYDIALNHQKEWVDTYPYRYDNLLSMAKGYEFKANLTGDKSFYDMADIYYQKSIALCPERQDLLYAYAEHLSNVDRKEEAIALLEKMQKQNPEIAQTQYYLGLVLAANDKKDYDKAMQTLEDSFDTGVVKGDPIAVKAVYEHFLVYYYEKGDVKKFRAAVRRLLWVDPSQAEAYKKISDYIDLYHTIPYLDIHS